MKLIGLTLAALALAPFALQRSASDVASPSVSTADAASGTSGSSVSSDAAVASAVARPRARTLYQQDFIRHSMSLASGQYGSAVQDHVVVNVDSELEYGAYYPDQLLAGVQGGQVGELLDLGTSLELAARYGYQETVGGGQGFSSIRFDGGRLVILADYATGALQPFVEGQAFLSAALPSSSTPAPVQLGHVYLVRIFDHFDPSFLRFAKLLVTDHDPNEHVTFVWDEIRVE